MSANRENFYSHLAFCDACEGEDNLDHFTLCELGRELLFEAVEDLPEYWQCEAKRIRKRENLEREADENFQFYAGEE